jgi:hypothetical protein
MYKGPYLTASSQGGSAPYVRANVVWKVKAGAHTADWGGLCLNMSPNAGRDRPLPSPVEPFSALIRQCPSLGVTATSRTKVLSRFEQVRDDREKRTTQKQRFIFSPQSYHIRCCRLATWVSSTL